MLRYTVLFIFFVSCTTAYIEETSNMVHIPGNISYDSTESGIQLDWTTQWDFSTVEVLRGEEASDLQSYKKNVVQTVLMDDDVVAGKDYYYQIKAYNTKGRQIGASAVLKGKRSYRSADVIELPTNLIASSQTYADKVELIWNGNTADNFRIYRANSATRSGSFQLIDEVDFSFEDELRYFDTNVEPATTYQYKISVVGKGISGEVEKYSEVVEGSTLDAPVGLVASVDQSASISLTWKSDSSVNYYKVYRSSTSDGEYKIVSQFVSGDSYLDKNLPDYSGQIVDGVYTYPSYFYKIQSVKKGVSSGLSAMAEGKPIDPKDYIEAPELQVALDSSTEPYQIKLSWSPDPSAPTSGVTYRVLKISESNKTNTIAASTTQGVFMLPVEEYDSLWTYQVSAVNDKGIVSGTAKQTYRHNEYLEAPTDMKIALDNSAMPYQLKISWKPNALNPDKGVAYRVLKVNEANETNQVVLSTTTTETSVQIEQFGTTWKYIVKAINNNASGVLGKPAVIPFRNTVPHPPVDITFGYKTIEHTNMTDVNKPMHVYYDSDGANNFVAGYIKKEWVITPEIKGIIINWSKGVETDQVTAYKIYRRAKGEEEFTLLASVAENTYTDTNMLADVDAYDYAMVAIYNEFESANSIPKQVSTYVAPAPAYLNIPGHWAKGIGFRSAKWRVGAESPEGAELVNGLGGVNHLYVVWGDVPSATTYKLSHSRGSGQSGWIVNENHQGVGTDKKRIQWYNNETTSNKYTGLYVGGDFFGYKQNSVSFEVQSMYTTVPGEKRGIWFEEPKSNPFK